MAKSTRRPGPDVPLPPFRRLRAYAFDPTLASSIDTLAINEATLQIRWEPDLAPGPVGEYLEVVDFDPASACFYAPLDLNDPALLAQDGLPVSEGTPQFHQQMVYAVAMRTIANFERALGRRALWSPRLVRDGGGKVTRADFVDKLRVYPHALREANAYYSPDKKALLFGYFPAQLSDSPGNLPGGMVFTCLSHDVIAHETTHALLDGLHRYFGDPSNPDVLAFHEAFADIVALFQHFTYPEAIAHQIAKTRGQLGLSENLLAQLAVQFGQAVGGHGALRDAIGTEDESGNWKVRAPRPEELEQTTEPHARGAILVAAVFEAFLTIYAHRTADLLRIATGGTGILPEGELHPDLVNRLSGEATKAAQHVLLMCIRALDYCPPVDITFGEYLRALITADFDLVRDDDLNYRVAFIEAFRRRGIYPRDVRTLSVESLRWCGPNELEERLLQRDFFPGNRKLELGDDLRGQQSRRRLYDSQLHNGKLLHEWIESTYKGLSPDGKRAARNLFGVDPARKFEVHSVRPALRNGPDGQQVTDLVIEIVQKVPAWLVEPEAPGRAKRSAKPRTPDFFFRGGCTIIYSLSDQCARYVIRKRTDSANRLQRQREFFAEHHSLYATYFTRPDGRVGEPFALLHRS